MKKIILCVLISVLLFACGNSQNGQDELKAAIALSENLNSSVVYAEGEIGIDLPSMLIMALSTQIPGMEDLFTEPIAFSAELQTTKAGALKGSITIAFAGNDLEFFIYITEDQKFYIDSGTGAFELYLDAEDVDTSSETQTKVIQEAFLASLASLNVAIKENGSIQAKAKSVEGKILTIKMNSSKFWKWLVDLMKDLSDEESLSALFTDIDVDTMLTGQVRKQLESMVKINKMDIELASDTQYGITGMSLDFDTTINIPQMGPAGLSLKITSVNKDINTISAISFPDFSEAPVITMDELLAGIIPMGF